MNIFFLSSDPVKAAQMHADKHVVKMLLESTQLLWTAHHVAAADAGVAIPEIETAPPTATGRTGGYRPTHRNHPCAIWVRASVANYRWLVALASSLADEYHYRYPTRREAHACEVHVAWLRDHLPVSFAAAEEKEKTSKQMTMPALAMPVEFKISPNPVTCYRAFYVGSKKARGIIRYTRRDAPAWLTQSPSLS
jgi:hypothetical protein